MPQTTCSAEGCVRDKVVAHGLCQKHYKRQWSAMAATCSAGECESRARTSGLCDTHYRKARAHRLPDCIEPDCGNKSNVKGLCNSHYFKARGEALGPCPVDGCGNNKRGPGQPCHTHWKRLSQGDPDWDTRPVRVVNQTPGATSPTKDGYVRERTGAGEWVLQHRLVMAAHIGRELTDDENVHHVNGDRADNRLSNLELWNTSQPSGQRIEDKVQWAKELLALYSPESLNPAA